MLTETYPNPSRGSKTCRDAIVASPSRCNGPSTHGIACARRIVAQRSAAMAMRVRIIESIRDIPHEAWDALHTDDDSPFVEWTWLEALEAAGCAAPRAGWAPRHLTFWRDGQLVAAAPAYVKGNSEGEFVYDWSWAGVAERLGIEYYPKFLVAVPFTPANGSRLLRAPGESLDEVAGWVAKTAIETARAMDLSSVHVNFTHEAECAALERQGLATRYGVQFHWRNEGYGTFDDFLARFQSKRRHAIKRERAQIERDAMRIDTLTGDAITPDLVDPMFRFYVSTVDKFFYGRRYLNKKFFERVVNTFRHRLHWVVARDADGTPVAGAFNATRGGRLYGRYWGADAERPFLHFNVCFYHSIAECIRAGWKLFEPGAGGEHKLARGFEPTITYSSHWIADRKLDAVLRDFMAREQVAVRESVDRELAESPLRRK
jgi:predicted N-acyltransferase